MDTTRRLFLAAGPAAAVFGNLNAAAQAAPGADPALAALAEYERAKATLNAAYARTSAAFDAGGSAAAKIFEEAEEAPFRASLAAENAALEARPTTPEGALRLLRHVADRLESDNLTDREAELVPDAIRAAADLLAAETASA